MQGPSHAVVWIDHRQARIFDLSATDADKLVVSPESPVRHLHNKANSIGHGARSGGPKIPREGRQAVSDAGAILIVGPVGAKGELVKHIRLKRPRGFCSPKALWRYRRRCRANQADLDPETQVGGCSEQP